MAKALIEIGFNQEAKDLLRAVVDSHRPDVLPYTAEFDGERATGWLWPDGTIRWVLPGYEQTAAEEGCRRLYVERKL